jgi:RHS repeat-associated protein
MKYVPKSIAFFAAFVLTVQPISPRVFAQQGEPHQPVNRETLPETDENDQARPDRYTDLPVEHERSNETSRNEEATYIYSPQIIDFINSIDFSTDPKAPDTWNPTTAVNPGNFPSMHKYLPWEGPTGGSLAKVGDLSIGGGDRLTGGGGSHGNRGQISGRINTNTGKMDFQIPIVSFAGRNDGEVNLSMHLTQFTDLGTLNHARMWTDSYDIRLDLSLVVGIATVRMPDGMLIPFTRNSMGQWLPPMGVRATLTNMMGMGYTLTWKNGERWTFFGTNSAQGRLNHINFPNGGFVSISRGQTTTTISAGGSRSVTIETNNAAVAPGVAYRISGPHGITDIRNETIPTIGPVPTTVVHPGGQKIEKFLVAPFTRQWSGGGGNGIATMGVRLTGYVDPRGNQTLYGFDLSNRLTSVRNPEMRLTTYQYDFPQVGQTTITDPRGKTWVDYYVNGVNVGSKDPNGFTTLITRNAEHDIIGYRNERGQSWRITRNAAGDATAVTNPRNKTWTYAYDSRGNLLSKRTPLNHITTFEYELGRNYLKKVTDPLGRVVLQATYGPNGPTSVKDALNRTTSFVYNSEGDVTSVTDPSGLTTTVTLNTLGLPVSTTAPGGRTTTIQYDTLMRPFRITGPTGIQTNFGYDLNDNLVSVRDGLNRSTSMVYDAMDRMTRLTNPRNDIENYKYDFGSNLIEVINGRGASRKYTYTDRGDLKKLTLPDGAWEEYFYNGDGSLSEFQASGRTPIHYRYNAAGNLTDIDYLNMTDTIFTYDDSGRKISMSDVSGLTSWFYNAADELVQLNQGGRLTSYEYNAAGERTRMVQPGGSTSYAYDAVGRFTGLTNPFGETTTFSYDPLNRLKEKLVSSGLKETYTYDTLDRLTQMQIQNSGSAALRTEGYTYNNASEVTSHTVNGVTTNYGYDANSQLTSETRPGYSAAYTYDGNGNRLTKTLNGVVENYTYDTGDKMLTAGNKSYQYDAAGRTIRVTSPSGITNLAYDEESRLTSVTGAGGNHSYTYNGLDTRMSKTANGMTTQFHRDGAYVTDPVIWDSGATYTPGISERRSNATRYLHSGLKNATAQSDATQAIAATRQYDAFGMVTNQTGNWSGPFGYAGGFGYQEDETGLRLLGHRYYDPSTGRFLTRDPIKDGRNWYSYCENNPISSADASGLKPGDPFETADEAAADFAKNYGPLSDSENIEYGSFIYRGKDGKYYYGVPVKGKARTSVDPLNFNPIPAGAELVGTIHTHPHGRPDEIGRGIRVINYWPDNSFSDADIRVYHRGRRRADGSIATFGLTHYVVLGDTGVIDKYVVDPKNDPGGVNWPDFGSIKKLPGYRGPIGRYKPNPNGPYGG